MIVKIRYIAKNTGIAKIEIFAMHSIFRYIAKIRYDSEIIQRSEFSSTVPLATVPFSLLHFSSIFCSSFLLVSDL